MILTTRPSRNRAGAWLALGTFALVATTSFAARSFLQEGRYTLEELKRYAAAVTNDDDGIPIVVNENVLKEVNGFLGTPKGRRFIRNSLLRMPAYRPLIEKKIAEFQLPTELLAIPIVESGYINQPAVSTEESHAPGVSRGAGLWMFVEQTALRYGLVVSGETDERLDIDRETVAAMKYLRDLHGMFKNWDLAMAAYNQGEHYVEEQKKQAGTNDAWELTRQGRLNNYLSKVMAAILILKCPALQPH